MLKQGVNIEINNIDTSSDKQLLVLALSRSSNDIDLELVQLLLKKGAYVSPDALCDVIKRTLIGFSDVAKDTMLDVFKFLIEHARKININGVAGKTISYGYLDKTPLSYAIEWTSCNEYLYRQGSSVIESLLKSGAYVSADMLRYAIKNDRYVAGILLKNAINIDINGYNEDGFTPLWQALSQDDLELAQLIRSRFTALELENMDNKSKLAFFWSRHPKADCSALLLIARAEDQLKEKNYAEFMRLFASAEKKGATVFAEYLERIFINGKTFCTYSTEDMALLLSLKNVQKVIINTFAAKTKYSVGMFCQRLCEEISGGYIRFNNNEQALRELSSLSHDFCAEWKSIDEHRKNLQLKCGSSANAHVRENNETKEEFCVTPGRTCMTAAVQQVTDCEPSAPLASEIVGDGVKSGKVASLLKSQGLFSSTVNVVTPSITPEIDETSSSIKKPQEEHKEPIVEVHNEVSSKKVLPEKSDDIFHLLAGLPSFPSAPPVADVDQTTENNEQRGQILT